MNRKELLTFIDVAVRNLITQYAKYNRIDGILNSGTEPIDSQKVQSAGRNLFSSQTKGKWTLFSNTHQKIRPERRIELELELQKISDSMKFANPAVWMMYKATAYIGMANHNPTMQSFVDHTRHEQICGKRIAYLNAYLRAKHYGDDLFSGTLLPLDMDTAEAAKSELALSLCEDEVLMSGWIANEYGQKGKWLDYLLT